jgi:hypothetical protein
LAKAPAAAHPAENEVEVSIFGPGKGEAVVIHLGSGQWITIDSCRDQTSNQNAVLSYFETIGVDTASDVLLVVGTHAHDDHVAGISSIYSAAQNAQFVTSRAITSTEFYASVVADEDIEQQLRQTVRAEYRSVFAEVKRRGKFADGRHPAIHAWEQRELWSRPADSSTPSVKVISLSPSEVAIDRSLDLLRRGSARADERRRLASGDPNEFAIAIWVEIGDISILLGGDLIRGPEDCGWKAVVQSHSPRVKASVHKVPHHGSVTAHHSAVWSELLDDQVISLLAPFRAGRTVLPNADDIKRIKSLSSAAFTAARPSVPTPSSSVRKTRAALSGVASNIREPYGRVGQVRARNSNGAWTVDTYDPADRL